MNKTRQGVQNYKDKEEFLRHYLQIMKRRDKAAALSVRLTNVLNHMRLGAVNREWEITHEDLGR